MDIFQKKNWSLGRTFLDSFSLIMQKSQNKTCSDSTKKHRFFFNITCKSIKKVIFSELYRHDIFLVDKSILSTSYSFKKISQILSKNNTLWYKNLFANCNKAWYFFEKQLNFLWSIFISGPHLKISQKLKMKFSQIYFRFHDQSQLVI